jgi:hypothetical protein
MTTTDKVERSFSILNSERLFDTRSEHFEEIRIVRVEANVREDIAVGDDTECSENNDDWNWDLDVG